MRTPSMTASIALCTAMLATAAHATTPLTASSSATILSGNVAIGSTNVVVPPQATAAGSGPPAYAARKTLKTYSTSIPLPVGTSLSVNTGALSDTASSAGIVGTAITAKAKSSASTVVFKLSNPFVSGTVTVTAAKIVSSAAFTTRTTGAPIASGSASITTGSVDLSLFGLGVHTYSGAPKPNTVLYQSTDGTVTVYGNQHVIGHASGSNVATSITVNAIDVHLVNAHVLGQPFNGDLAAGTCVAQ